ncbi:DUF3592 domain-containing protein [Nocardia noduli]|uniref:DUF3592 domain-containing protein n=1 Tax=Nocardia noduli TaxID=2815722 RepID=UPI001C2230BA|nr:DUF3592 domain-containing protein [Nocardia noduli]
MIAIGFGLIMIALGIGSFYQTLGWVSLWMRGHRATGKVVSVEEDDSPVENKRRNYWLTVEFVDATGERRTSRLAYTVRTARSYGDSVQVLYRPGDHSHVVAPDLAGGVTSVLSFPLLVAAGLTVIVMALGIDLPF